MNGKLERENFFTVLLLHQFFSMTDVIRFKDRYLEEKNIHV